MNESDSPVSSESGPDVCPKCGAPLPPDAPEGLCPRCLGALNLTADTVLTGDDSQPGVSRTPPPTPEDLAPHFPQLEILECLGRGGMGVVYKARQKSLNRLVALKLLAPEREKDPAFAERFAHEAKALATLNHPNIVTIHDFGESDGFFFLLMEFVDGVNLRQAMSAGRFTPEQALAIVPPVCEALQYAHDQGIVHRDIKPENLLMDKEGKVKIADFGIAKMLDAESGASTESSVVGTPRYMAPEQIENPELTDSRADIYSLGVVLYEMLTGESPAGKIEPPSARAGGVRIDVKLDEVVLRALAEEPELRFQTAGEFKTRLETITSDSAQLPTLADVRPPALPPSPPSSGSRWWLPAIGSLWLVAALVLMLGREVARTQPLMYHFFGKGAWLYPGTYHALVIGCVLIGGLFFCFWWGRDRIAATLSRVNGIWIGPILGLLFLLFLFNVGGLQVVHVLILGFILFGGWLVWLWRRQDDPPTDGANSEPASGRQSSRWIWVGLAAGILVLGLMYKGLTQWLVDRLKTDEFHPADGSVIRIALLLLLITGIPIAFGVRRAVRQGKETSRWRKLRPVALSAIPAALVLLLLPVTRLIIDEIQAPERIGSLVTSESPDGRHAADVTTFRATRLMSDEDHFYYLITLRSRETSWYEWWHVTIPVEELKEDPSPGNPLSDLDFNNRGEVVWDTQAETVTFLVGNVTVAKYDLVEFEEDRSGHLTDRAMARRGEAFIDELAAGSFYRAHERLSKKARDLNPREEFRGWWEAFETGQGGWIGRDNAEIGRNSEDETAAAIPCQFKGGETWLRLQFNCCGEIDDFVFLDRKPALPGFLPVQSGEPRAVAEARLTFGPAIVATVSREGAGSAINFETGELFTPPPARAADLAWVKQEGIDAIGFVDNDIRGLVTTEGTLVRHVTASVWETLSVHDAIALLRGPKKDGQGSVVLQAGDNLGNGSGHATWVFQTREGSVGLIQVLHLEGESGGIRIRYKLVTP